MKYNINRHLSIVITLSLLAIFCLSACTRNSEVTTSPQIRIVEHNLSIHKFGGDVLQNLATVEGKAENTSKNMINHISIIVSFYDKNNSLLQTASTIKEGWTPGEIWNFTVKITSQDAWKTTRYTISTSTD